MMMTVMLVEATLCGLATGGGRGSCGGGEGRWAKSEEVKGCCRCLKTIAAC